MTTTHIAPKMPLNETRVVFDFDCLRLYTEVNNRRDLDVIMRRMAMVRDLLPETPPGEPEELHPLAAWQELDGVRHAN